MFSEPTGTSHLYTFVCWDNLGYVSNKLFIRWRMAVLSPFWVGKSHLERERTSSPLHFYPDIFYYIILYCIFYIILYYLILYYIILYIYVCPCTYTHAYTKLYFINLYIYIYAYNTVLRTCLSHKYCFHCQLGCQEATLAIRSLTAKGSERNRLCNPKPLNPNEACNIHGRWALLRPATHMTHSQYACVGVHEAFGHLSTFGADVHACTHQGQLQKNWSGTGKAPLTCPCNLGPFSYGYSHGDHSPIS